MAHPTSVADHNMQHCTHSCILNCLIDERHGIEEYRSRRCQTVYIQYPIFYTKGVGRVPVFIGGGGGEDRGRTCNLKLKHVHTYDTLYFSVCGGVGGGGGVPGNV